MSFMCKDVVENIIGYIESELDIRTLEELETHTSDCPECSEFVKTYKKMLEMTGKLREKTFVTPEIRENLKNLLRSKLQT